jgi:hypothetical protein
VFSSPKIGKAEKAKQKKAEKAAKFNTITTDET